MKLLYASIIACVARTIIGAGNYYITATNWMIGRDQTALQIVNEAAGTCFATDPSSTVCAQTKPVDVKILPLTPSTTSTSTTRMTTSTDNPACVVACATQKCPGFRTSTNCFCGEVKDIGFCMVGDCASISNSNCPCGKALGTHSHSIHVHTN